MKTLIAALLLLAPFSALSAVSTTDRALIERGNNLLVNGGWESGKAQWASSGGTYSTTTTAANLGKGSVAGSWNSSGAAQTLTSTAVAIPAGLYGRNGVGSCLIQGASATHTLQAYDGSNILASTTITSQTAYARTSVNFIFPSSGSVSLRLVSVAADEPLINIDDCYLGDAEGYNISQISQAQFYGAVKITGCSGAWTTTSGSYTNLSAQTSCSYSASGNASAPATLIPGIRFASGLPAGTYAISYSGEVGRQASTATVFGRFSDGTNTSLEETYLSPTTAGSTQSAANFLGTFIVPTGKGDTTIQVQLKQSGGTAQIFGTTSTPGVISVYRFPSTSEIAYRPDVINRSGSIKVAGATNCTWTTTSASYASFTADSDCGTQTVVGSVTAPGTKLAAGTFTDLPAGKYFAIAQGKFVAEYATTATDCNFQLYDGTNSIATASSYATSGTAFDTVSTISGVVNYSALQSSISLEVRGMRASGGGNCNITNASTSNIFSISLIPLDQSLPMPSLVGSVTSGYTGETRHEVANINCDAGSAITSQLGTWVSSIGNISGGACAVTLTSGAFSSAPYCFAIDNSGFGATGKMYSAQTTSATALSVDCEDDASNACASFDTNIMCIGPK